MRRRRSGLNPRLLVRLILQAKKLGMAVSGLDPTLLALLILQAERLGMAVSGRDPTYVIVPA